MYLEHLITRAIERTSGLHPRRAARFEPSQPFSGVVSGDATGDEEARLASGGSPVTSPEPLVVTQEIQEAASPEYRIAPGSQAEPQLRMPPGQLVTPAPGLSSADEGSRTASDLPPPQLERHEERPASQPTPPLPIGFLPNRPRVDAVAKDAVSPPRQSIGHGDRVPQERSAPTLLHPSQEAGEVRAVAQDSSPPPQLQQELRPVFTSHHAQEGDSVALVSIRERLETLAQMLEDQNWVTQAAPGRPEVDRAQVSPALVAPRPAPQSVGAPASDTIVPEVRPAHEPSRRLTEIAVTTARPEPTIQITIGRIEVRASSVPSHMPRKATAPKLSLDDYLRQRQAQQGG